jgi:hypothetical protein
VGVAGVAEVAEVVEVVGRTTQQRPVTVRGKVKATAKATAKAMSWVIEAAIATRIVKAALQSRRESVTSVEMLDCPLEK